MNEAKRNDERWRLVRLALDDATLSDRAKLIAIGSVVMSRMPYLQDDIARTRKLIEQYQRETRLSSPPEDPRP